MTLLQGKLVFHIEEAKDLPNTDWIEWTGSDMTDPFVVGKIGKIELFRTKHIDNTCNPVWNEKFTVSVNEKAEFIKIKIQDDELLAPPEEVGTLKIPCDKVVKSEEIKGWFDLDFHGRTRGKIKILIKYYPEHTK